MDPICRDLYRMTIADVTLDCSFIFPETASCFGSWCRGPYLGSKDIPVMISETYLQSWEDSFGPIDANAERSAFAAVASEALLDHDRFLMHAVAVRRQDKAYLITAPSGVGKSRQARTLRELYPGEFSIICGDRPVIEDRGEEGYMVHPSPWNGKEGWHGAGAAPLSAIICLRRGEENRIERLPTRKSAALVYSAVIQTAESEEKVRRIAEITAGILEKTPIWRLTNKGVPDSTRLLYETVIKGDIL